MALVAALLAGASEVLAGGVCVRPSGAPPCVATILNGLQAVQDPSVSPKHGTGIDVVRSGTGTKVMRSTVRVASVGVGIRRACDRSLALHDTTLWYVGLLPSPAGRLLKEVAGSGTCTALTYSALEGAQDVTRLQLLATPNGLGEFRGSTVPFACPGTNLGANALGTQWADTTTNKERVCTSSGWQIQNTI